MAIFDLISSQYEQAQTNIHMKIVLRQAMSIEKYEQNGSAVIEFYELEDACETLTFERKRRIFQIKMTRKLNVRSNSSLD